MPPQAVDQQPSSVAPGGTVPPAPATSVTAATAPGNAFLANASHPQHDPAPRHATTFRGLTGRGITTDLLVGLSIGAAVVLTAVGIAAGVGAAVVLGVVIGVAAAFVVASRGVGEGKAR